MGSAPSKQSTADNHITVSGSPDNTNSKQWIDTSRLVPFMEKLDDGTKGKILSQKDITKRHEENMKSLKADIQLLKAETSKGTQSAGLGSNYSTKFKEAVKRIEVMCWPTQRSHFQQQLQYSEKIAHELAASGTLHSLCDLAVSYLTHSDNCDGGKIAEDMFEFILNVVMIVESTSDTSVESGMDVCRHPQYFTCITQKMTVWKDQHMKDLFDLERNKLLWYFLFTIYNCSSLEQNVARLRHLKCISLLESYLESPLPILRLNAFLSIGCLAKEKDSNIIHHHADILDFLAQIFAETMNSSSRGNWGYSTKGLAETLKKIAKNEKMKKALVEHGLLPLLIQLTSSKDVEEQIIAVKTIRTLSFEKENQLYIVSHPELKVIEILTKLQHSENDVVRRVSEGTLWNLREVLHQEVKYKDVVETFYEKPQVPNTDTRWHIMISYQWDKQQTVKKVRDEVRSIGYKVWMDVDNMEGSTVQAMAHAVENAEIILLCFSDKYKNSDNCRAEAEYAFQLKKKIIPLKMEKNYKPDGWLGFIIGSKLYHDFGGGHSFESRIEGLLKELRSNFSQTDGHENISGLVVNAGGGSSARNVETANISEHSQDMNTPRYMVHDNSLQLFPQPPFEPVLPGKHLYSPATNVYNETVMQWASSDVIKWLDKHNLDRSKFSKLTGKQIAFLKVQRIESPDFFYTSLVKFMNINDLETLSNFVCALDDVPY